MDFLTDIWTAWNEQWGVTIATILALLALLKNMGKEVQQLGSNVWHWKGWAVASTFWRRVVVLYRVRKAKNVMRRSLEEKSLRIEVRAYESCLQDDPSKSTRIQLNDITPVEPVWLNDHYVATALERLATEGAISKATRYSVNSWPPKPETYDFVAVSENESACEEAVRRETNDKCVIYQTSNLCPRPSRFEPHHVAETISPRETRFLTTYQLKDMTKPCGLCWEQEQRERDIRGLVDNITRYDFAGVATLEVTGPNRELQEVIVETCIESQCPAEATLIKSVVKQALEVRQRQLARSTLPPEYEWREGVLEELVATIKCITSQSAASVKNSRDI